jgi:hypothetical protein
MINLNKELEEKRERLNKIMKSEYRLDYDNVLKLSQEIDKLIVRYIQEKKEKQTENS